MTDVVGLIHTDPKRAAEALLDELRVAPEKNLWLILGRLADAWRVSGHVSAARAALLCAFKCAPSESEARANLVYRHQRLLFDCRAFEDAEVLLNLRGSGVTALLDAATTAWAVGRLKDSEAIALKALGRLSPEEIPLRRWAIQLLIHSRADANEPVGFDVVDAWLAFPTLTKELGAPYYQACWTSAVVERALHHHAEADRLYDVARKGLLDCGQVLGFASITLELIALKLESQPSEAQYLAGEVFPILAASGLEEEARAALLAFLRAASRGLTLAVVTATRSALRRAYGRTSLEAQ